MTVADTPAVQVAPIDMTAPAARRLLDQLFLPHGRTPEAVVRTFDRVFTLRSPFAEHLAFVGAQIAVPLEMVADSGTRLSVGGTGQTIGAAFHACIGEGIELASQFERAGDIVRSARLRDVVPELPRPLADWIAAHGQDEDRGADVGLDWVRGLSLDGGKTLLPADLCLRRSRSAMRLAPLAPLSVGCAAGATREDAMMRALLELIERDAASLWWHGGRRGRRLAMQDPAHATMSETIAGLRGSAVGRTSWLLDISTELGVPVLAAVSVDERGRGLACGLAARLDRRQAADAAIREMMQVELAYAVIAAKLEEGGEPALAASDRRHLARARDIDIGTCALLHPSDEPATMSQPACHDVFSLVDSLRSSRIEIKWHDLSRQELGLPVVRAIAPALQTSAASPPTERFQRARESFGGGMQYHRGNDLF